MVKQTVIALVLCACSSETTTMAASGGQAGAAGAAGAAGQESGGGAGGAGGAGASGSGGVVGGGGSAGAGGDSGVVPACAPEAAITKLALAEVTWPWQSYSDQKIATPNQCIACANSPCGTSCSMAPVVLQWDKPAPGELSPYGDATCAPTLMKVGACGSELTCNLTPKFLGYLTAKPVPTATGWKLAVVSAKAGADWMSFGGACGANFIDAQVLGKSLSVGIKQAFEAAEFPCP